MPSDFQTKIKLKQLLVLLVSIWLGLGLYILLSELSSFLTSHHHQNRIWQQFEFMTLKVWLPWIFLTPLVILLANRFPFKPQNWLSGILLHSIILILLSVVEVAFVSLHYHYFGDLSVEMQTYAPWQHIGHFLFGDALFLFNLIIYTFMVASLNIRNFSQLAQQKELLASQLTNQLMQSQLQTLKMQINPHFLFNTLNVISVLVMKAENKQAGEMINRLSRFFRQTLEEDKEQWVTLDKELARVGEYLAIEKVRFGDRLVVIEKFDESAMSVFVPSMLLQPLVENAMRHGLGEKEGVGTLTLECLYLQKTVRINIIDDGQGCNFNDASTYQEGIGLTNTRGRLQQLYGDAHQFMIKNCEQGGVIVSIELPVNSNQTQVKLAS